MYEYKTLNNPQKYFGWRSILEKKILPNNLDTFSISQIEFKTLIVIYKIKRNDSSARKLIRTQITDDKVLAISKSNIYTTKISKDDDAILYIFINYASLKPG